MRGSLFRAGFVSAVPVVSTVFGVVVPAPLIFEAGDILSSQVFYRTGSGMTSLGSISRVTRRRASRRFQCPFLEQ
jgi:hypothetical protein